MRRLACLGLVACSQLLGLAAPKEQGDAAAGSDAAIDASADAAIDAPTGDFSFQVTTKHPRVPAGGFDFLDISVTRTGSTGDIDITVPQPPLAVTVMPLTIAAGATTGELKVTGDSGLAIGNNIALHVVATGGGNTHAADLVLAVTPIPGTPDPTFGASGAVSVFGSASACNDLAVGSDGKITAIGQISGQGGAVRLLASGVTDGSFAVVQTDQGEGPGRFASGALAADNGIVTGGQTGDVRQDDVDQAWLARFSSAGAQVKPFGDANGFDFFDSFTSSGVVGALKIDANNNILAIIVDSSSGPAIVRQSIGGITDTGFNGGQRLGLGLGITGPAALALDTSGATAYVVGTGSGVPKIQHVTGTGTLDTTFSAAADAALAGFGSAATAGDALAVQPDGSLVIAGRPAYITRLHADGSLDTGFGTSGIVAIGLTSIAGVAVQSDGKIVVAGMSGATARIDRLLPDGTPDPTFGTSGGATIKLGTVNALRLQADDSAVTCGVTSSQATVARAVF